ncbi:MAG: TIGR01620 family protein [Hyphomicrobiaceae bacterium]
MSDDTKRRKPELIPLDDPDLVVAPEGLAAGKADEPEPKRGPATPVPDETRGSAPVRPRLTTGLLTGRGLPWGAILVTSLSLLGGIAITLAFTSFVAAAFQRQDWIGWVSFGLMVVAAVALVAIVGREVGGLLRLRRLGRSRRALETALVRGDAAGEWRAIEEIFAHLGARPELKWPLARLSEHAREANDPGDLAHLADRDVMPVLDGDARRLVAATARRVSVVTALSPVALLTVSWVLVENLKLLRRLATLYGGRPGLLGTTRLARMVFTHIVATGGLALTDDLLGQFLGQDLVRRLSRRLGEGIFNAALTARVGAAAIEVIRPLPYLEAPRVRARDFLAEIIRWSRSDAPAEKSDANWPLR